MRNVEMLAGRAESFTTDDTIHLVSLGFAVGSLMMVTVCSDEQSRGTYDRVQLTAIEYMLPEPFNALKSRIALGNVVVKICYDDSSAAPDGVFNLLCSENTYKRL